MIGEGKHKYFCDLVESVAASNSRSQREILLDILQPYQGKPWQNASVWLRLFGKLLSFMHTLSLIKRALLNRSKDLMTVLCIYRNFVQEHPGRNTFKWAWGIVFPFLWWLPLFACGNSKLSQVPSQLSLSWWANLGKICYSSQEKIIPLIRLKI